MELPLFEQVSDLVRALAPEGHGDVRMRAHRRGIKVWFDAATPTREHYEAQMLSRRYVDDVEGVALEIGFHIEHPEPDRNRATVASLEASEKKWRKSLGSEPELGPFFGQSNWRRCSEAWIEPDLDDPDLAFEVASRLVDYMVAIEPIRS